jgi:hypothetical protein
MEFVLYLILGNFVLVFLVWLYDFVMKLKGGE